MKNLLTAFLPALALLALGGCASTSGLATSEDDGVYYSSKDRTTAIVSTAPAQEPTSEEAANPDYNGNTANSSTRQNSGSDQYYDNTYTYMRGVPNYGVTYYTPYSPYTSINYAWGMGACGYSPFGICDPFYSPFYSPFGYGYGSGVNISLGFGRPWGYGGYGGYGYGRPYGYGYGGGFYDPYYYNSPFYGGYYGRGAYYGSNNYGYSNRYNGNRYNSNGNDNSRARTSGHRSDRVTDGRYTSGSAGSAGGSGSAPVTGNGRVRSDDRMLPATPQTATAAPEGRVRNEAVGTNQMEVAAPDRAEGYNQPRRQSRVAEQPVYRDMSQSGNGNDLQIIREENSRRQRNVDVATPQGGQMQPQPAAPQEGQRRRGGFLQNIITESGNANGQAAEQPQRQRSYEQPRQQQRTYEQPRQQAYEQPRQPSYEQPRQQSYEQPQRSSQPSYSAPSGGGGGGGGHSRGRAD